LLRFSRFDLAVRQLESQRFFDQTGKEKRAHSLDDLPGAARSDDGEWSLANLLMLELEEEEGEPREMIAVMMANEDEVYPSSRSPELFQHS
jgi:hypothetical protein